MKEERVRVQVSVAVTMKNKRDGKVEKYDKCGNVQGAHVVNGTSELLVGFAGNRSKFNDADSNSLITEDNFDLVLVFDLIG